MHLSIAQAVGIVSMALSVTATPAPMKRAAKNYCKPSDLLCWPNTFEWNAFNQTLGGKLIKVIPWGSPCFQSGPTGYNKEQCEAISSVYLQGPVRAQQVGTMQQDNWAACHSNEGDDDDCQLNALIPALGSGSLPYTKTCKLGRISPYAVKILTAEDAQKAFAFAQRRNIRVTIKNTGHDYVGRAAGPDGLTLWTKQMTSMKYEENFMGFNAIRLGAGVLAQDVYKFAKENGKSITLGASNSVGVAGGFALGGGHGPLGPTRGLAVDNILQFTVVTPDGQIRTANSNSNADLFWALRGGGGGVYGLVTEVVYKVYPATSMVAFRLNATYNGHVNVGDKDKDIAGLVEKLAELTPKLHANGWSGYTFLYEDYATFNYAVPSSDIAIAERDMGEFLKYTQEANVLGLKSFKVVTSTKLWPTVQEYVSGVLTLNDADVPVAFSQRITGRLIPTEPFESPESRKKLATDVVAAMRANVPSLSIQRLLTTLQPISFQIYMSGPKPAKLGGPSGASTGVNTAWRNSYWEIVAATGWIVGVPQGITDELARNSNAAMNGLRQYGSGCYLNEASALEEDWKTAFFGANYDRLLSIKSKYDPTGVLNVYKGIGWEGQEDQNAYRCYQKA